MGDPPSSCAAPCSSVLGVPTRAPVSLWYSATRIMRVLAGCASLCSAPHYVPHHAQPYTPARHLPHHPLWARPPHSVATPPADACAACALSASTSDAENSACTSLASSAALVPCTDALSLSSALSSSSRPLASCCRRADAEEAAVAAYRLHSPPASPHRAHDLLTAAGTAATGRPAPPTPPTRPLLLLLALRCCADAPVRVGAAACPLERPLYPPPTPLPQTPPPLLLLLRLVKATSFSSSLRT